MNNLSSYCGLVDAKIRASDKYLPVQKMFEHTARRIFDIPENKDLIDQVRHFKELNGGSLTITFYAGIGPDGSTGERSE